MDSTTSSNILQFPTVLPPRPHIRKISAELILKKGYLYCEGELTEDRQHKYCQCTDVFWSSARYDEIHDARGNMRINR